MTDKETKRRAVCEHGNAKHLGICPACANAAMAKRQIKADRARFKAQLAKIRGERS